MIGEDLRSQESKPVAECPDMRYGDHGGRGQGHPRYMAGRSDIMVDPPTEVGLRHLEMEPVGGAQVKGRAYVIHHGEPPPNPVIGATPGVGPRQAVGVGDVGDRKRT
jgi:hypothetical protein